MKAPGIHRGPSLFSTSIYLFGVVMSPNIPLLRKYVEWVEWQATLPEYHPDRDWDQGTWFRKAVMRLRRSPWHPQPRDERGRFVQMQEQSICRTSYCVAGRTVLDAGYKITDGGTITGTPKGKKADVGKSASEVATEILGLNSHQAGQLFAGSNSAPMIRAICEEIAADAGERLF